MIASAYIRVQERGKFPRGGSPKNENWKTEMCEKKKKKCERSQMGQQMRAGDE